jgi:hypothetical protein
LFEIAFQQQPTTSNSLKTPISYLPDLGLTKESMSDDEFDNIPDDFAEVQGVDWAHLLAGPSSSSYTRSARPIEARTQVDPGTHSTPPHSNSLSSSSSYFSDDDEMDASFLAELNRVEQSIVVAPHVASSHLQILGKVASFSTNWTNDSN